MKNKTHISWWSNKVPDLSNWIPEHFNRLDSSQKAELKACESTREFVQDLGDDLTPQFVLNSSAIANRVDQRILQLHGNGIQKVWYILLIALFVGITVGVIYMQDENSEASSKLTTVEQKHEKPKEQTQESLDRDQNKSLVNMDSEAPLTIDEEEATNSDHKDESTQIDKHETKLTADITNNHKTELDEKHIIPDIDAEKEEKKTDTKTKLIGYKIVDGNDTKKASRDNSVPLSIQKVSIEHLDNYANHLNAPKVSSKITHGELEQKNQDANKHIKFAPADIPSYSGGNERLEEHLKLNLSRIQLEKKYDHPVSVMASFVVNPKGQLENIKIYGSETAEIKKASIKALQDLDPFQKGKKSGKRGSAYYEIMFSFN